MAAVVSACLLSGLAGVWLERIVKRTTEVPTTYYLLLTIYY